MLPPKMKKIVNHIKKILKTIFIYRGENPLLEYVIIFQEGIDLIGKF